MSKTVISVRNLGKKYQLGATLSPDTLRDHIMNITGRLLGSGNGEMHRAKKEEFWALKNVSFDVQQGEVLGIIGPNGAGKSTLLKILTGITEPTEGEIRMKGRTGSLLEVGTGFHQELTGRENIYMNGAILGMTRAEINAKFAEIVAFSGVEKFLDTPVKRYSSGMRVRLGFAVAAHLEPEILLIDEVLAVGDTAFQKKCLGKMDEVAKGGRTVLFVSHNMGAIKRLCSRAILIQNGIIKICNGPETVISAYLSETEEQKKRSHSGKYISGFEFYATSGSTTSVLAGEGGKFQIHYDTGGSSLRMVTVTIGIYDLQGVKVIQLGTNLSLPNRVINELTGTGMILCSLPCLNIVPGTYRVNVAIDGNTNGQKFHDDIQGAYTLSVLASDFYGTTRMPTKGKGYLLAQHHWSLIDSEGSVL